MNIKDHRKKTELTQPDEENFTIESLFVDSDIEEIWNHSNPLLNIYDLIEKNLRAKTGKIDFDSNLIMALAEFHVNNLIYFKENFKFPTNIYCKLMNLMNILLNLREESINNNPKEEYKTVTTSSICEEDKQITSNTEIDFSLICRNKLKDLKKGLIKLDLIAQDKKKTGGVQMNREDNYYLKNNEVALILDYVNTFYFPFIRLYYHFINIERITENKKIDVIINRPLKVPPLNVAVKLIQEKIQYDEQNLADGNEDKKDVNFVFLRFLKKFSKIFLNYLRKIIISFNFIFYILYFFLNFLQDKADDKKEDGSDDKKDEKVGSIQDFMNKMNIKQETIKIIEEKITELNKDVNLKILDRQKKLDEKLREVEDIVKGKKK